MPQTNYARFASPFGATSRFPQINLANSTVGPEYVSAVQNDLAFKQSIGWTLLDSGNFDADYHYEGYGSYSFVVPNGFHAEAPSASWSDGSTPQQYFAIVPNGKKRADIGA